MGLGQDSKFRRHDAGAARQHQSRSLQGISLPLFEKQSGHFFQGQHQAGLIVCIVRKVICQPLLMGAAGAVGGFRFPGSSLVQQAAQILEGFRPFVLVVGDVGVVLRQFLALRKMSRSAASASAKRRWSRSSRLRLFETAASSCR